jgi:hypothetical protein
MKLTSKNPLPVPAVAVSKPRALNYVHTSSHTSRLIAHNSSEKIKINVQKTTADTGKASEQAQVHEL